MIPALSAQWGETVTALVVPAGDPENPGVSTEELTSFTQEWLAAHGRVRRVESVPELPTTATGKARIHGLREQEWAGGAG